jgi:hypothetical protein
VENVVVQSVCIDENGRARGKFSKKALKPYWEETQHEVGTDGDVRSNKLPCRNYREGREEERDRIEYGYTKW